jgi:hypothetical protein
MPTQVKNLLINCSILLLSLIITFFLTELAARLFLPPPLKEYKEIYPKKENEFRIVVLGDSHVYGQGIKNENLFTNILEEHLNLLGSQHTFSVINAGVRAYSINQEVAFFEHIGIKLQPDFVLLCFYINDFAIEDIKHVYQRCLTKANHDGNGYFYFDIGTPASEKSLRLWQHIQTFRQSPILMYVYDRINAFNAVDSYEAKFLKGICDDKIENMIRQVEDYFEIFKELLRLHNVQGAIMMDTTMILRKTLSLNNYLII